jgi:hypothetical protein
MSFCAANCPGVDLVKNPVSGCTDDIRNRTTSRIIFFDCSTDLPSPITCESISSLFEDGSIVASSELANIVWNDPDTEDVVVSDCQPAIKKVVGRTLTFEDRIAISTSVGSPPVTNRYFDYGFWKDKKSANLRLRYGIVDCNGDVTIARDADGNPLRATLQVFLAFQKASTQGGPSVEFKKGSLYFAGDPLDLVAPDFNINDCDIVL